MTVTAEDVERTARDTNIALWGVASVVMAGSMVAGGFAFYHLNPSWWSAAVGVVTALAVDLALAQWLRISRRIRAADVEVIWGRILEIVTAMMTLYLNVGAAVFQGVNAATAKVLLAIAHSFLPVVLVLVSLAGGEAYLKLQRARHERESTERAERDAQLTTERAAHEAEQQRIQIERDQERTRQDRIRQDNLRAAEVTDATHQREVADRREDREQRSRELVASVASLLALGASLRRPPTRPRRVTAPIPKRPAVSRPKAIPTPVPVTEELLSQARRLRDERASQGKRTGRTVFQSVFGIPETTARELVRRLGNQPLTLVGSDR